MAIENFFHIANQHPYIHDVINRLISFLSIWKPDIMINKKVTTSERECSMFIGERLKEARIKKGITQEELGNLVGVTKVSVCGYELGSRTPSVDNFILLTDVLDVDPNYLLGRENFVISENEAPYAKRISRIDMQLLDEIKRHKRLYNYMVKDPKRSTDQMEILLKQELQ